MASETHLPPPSSPAHPHCLRQPCHAADVAELRGEATQPAHLLVPSRRTAAALRSLELGEARYFRVRSADCGRSPRPAPPPVCTGEARAVHLFMCGRSPRYLSSPLPFRRAKPASPPPPRPVCAGEARKHPRHRIVSLGEARKLPSRCWACSAKPASRHIPTPHPQPVRQDGELRAQLPRHSHPRLLWNAGDELLLDGAHERWSLPSSVPLVASHLPS